MELFISGLVIGFLLCFFLFLVAYIFIRELISRWGIQIKEKALNNLAKLEEKTISASFVFPEKDKEVFEKAEQIDDLLQ